MTTVLGRQRVAVAAGLRSFLREPTTLVLLVALPPAVIVAFELALAAFADVPGLAVDATAAAQAGTLFATAFLAGLLGVVQVVDAAEADRRLVVAGYRPAELLTARLLAVLLAGALVTAVTYATFRLRTDAAPAAPALAVAALLVAAVTYGLVGAVVGALLGRELEASLALAFLADFDAYAAVDAVPVDAAVVEYTPLARPASLFSAAVHDGTVPPGDALGAGAYLLALAALALVAVRFRGGPS